MKLGFISSQYWWGRGGGGGQEISLFALRIRPKNRTKTLGVEKMIDTGSHHDTDIRLAPYNSSIMINKLFLAVYISL